LLVFLALPLAALLVRAPLAWDVVADQWPVVARALALSLATSLAATALVVVLGTPLAYRLESAPGRWLRAVEPLIDLPMVLPPTVAGLGLLLAFGRQGLVPLGLPFTTAAVILAQAFVAAPFFVNAARVAFRSVEPGMLEAAATLGAHESRRFWRILLPLAAPGLRAGAVLALARALGEFGATIMFAGNRDGVTRTLPLAVYGALQSDPDVAVALSLVLLCFAALLLFLLRRIGPRPAGSRDA
jgi:molybdate transport system permease protein